MMDPGFGVNSSATETQFQLHRRDYFSSSVTKLLVPLKDCPNPITVFPQIERIMFNISPPPFVMRLSAHCVFQDR
jgi:hypothetical protein